MVALFQYSSWPRRMDRAGVERRGSAYVMGQSRWNFFLPARVGGAPSVGRLAAWSRPATPLRPWPALDEISFFAPAAASSSSRGSHPAHTGSNHCSSSSPPPSPPPPQSPTESGTSARGSTQHTHTEEAHTHAHQPLLPTPRPPWSSSSSRRPWASPSSVSRTRPRSLRPPS